MAKADAPQDRPGPSTGWEGGSGSTLVLLHGLTATWQVWKPVLPLLAQHHRVIALTLPGHEGGPPLPAGVEPSIEVFAELLAEDLRRRGIERPHVAGNSLGGWLALELARRGLVRSVTALSPAGGWQTREDYRAVAKGFRIVFAIISVMIFLTALFLRFAGVRRALNAKAMEHGDRMTVDEVRVALHSIRNTRMLPRLLDNMDAVGPIKPMAAGDALVRIAWCERDKVIPYERYGRPLIAAVRGSESLILKGVGHVPMHDDPELVAAAILETTRRAEGVHA